MQPVRQEEPERLTMLDLKIPKTTCPICGKDVARPSGAVKYCSDECRKVGNRMLHEMRAKQAYDSYTPKRVLCKICGKPVLPERGILRRYARKQMHEECVINDVIDTVLKGERISSCQMTRLVTRGLSKDDIIEEIKMREENENDGTRAD